MTTIARLAASCLALVAMAATAAPFDSDLIAVEQRGSGPDVVLLHGMASNSKVWGETARQFQDNSRVHLVDVAGLAGNPPPENIPEHYINAIRDELVRYIKTQELDNPVLVGHSMGGLVALMTASEMPDTVGRLVVVDALPFFSLLFGSQISVEAVRPRAKSIERQLLNMDEAAFKKQARGSVSRFSKDADKVDTLVEWSAESDRTVYAQLSREMMITDARPVLKDIRCPVLVLHAYDETMGNRRKLLGDVYKRAYSDVEDVRFRRVEGTYHFIMWDQPETFHRILREEISKVTTSASAE